jgi:DNA-binding NtrC family response regulator
MATKRLATIVPLPAPDADYRVLVEVLMELSRGVDLPSTFSAVAQGLARLTQFDWLCLTWAPPRGDGTLVHASLSGRPEWLATTSEVIDPGPAVNAWLLPESARVVSDALTCLASDAAQWPVPVDIGPLISVPMPPAAGGSRSSASRARQRGALLLGRAHPRPFEPGLVRLLEPCASHVAVLLEKTEWLERFRTANAGLREQLGQLRKERTDTAEATVRSISVPTSLKGRRAGDGPRWMAADPQGIEALEIVSRAAETDVAVLLCGESGTGKELMARSLHRLSANGRGPFVPVNVSVLTPELVASELFGHADGAFTGARGKRRGLIEDARNGTLFLDEIGEMPLAVQPTLLRFLEDGMVRPVGANTPCSVRTRLVCATNRDLLADIASGRFREDLYHRIAGIVVTLPPLRDRPADLLLLTREFLRQFSDGRRTKLPVSWWPAFRAHPWPGNVRELRNALRAVAAMSRGPDLEVRFLPQPLRRMIEHGDLDESSKARSSSAVDAYDGWTLGEVEREMIRRALLASDGHRGRTAQGLGITPRTLYDKIKKLGLA